MVAILDEGMDCQIYFYKGQFQSIFVFQLVIFLVVFWEDNNL